jgi:hypothetical protein
MLSMAGVGGGEFQMPEFVGLVASAEGDHKVSVVASSESEAKRKLEIDFGRGNVRAIERYSANTTVDPDKLRERDKEIADYGKSYKRRTQSPSWNRGVKPDLGLQAMMLVIGSIAAFALLTVFFGNFVVKWLFEQFGAFGPQ